MEKNPTFKRLGAGFPNTPHDTSCERKGERDDAASRSTLHVLGVYVCIGSFTGPVHLGAICNDSCVRFAAWYDDAPRRNGLARDP